MKRRGIPYARTLIEATVAEIESRAAPSELRDKSVAALREALFHMRRNVEKRPSRRISRRMDRDLVQSIMLAVIANPGASNKEIGDRFGVQAGRVTEVRQGRYDHLMSAELQDALARSRHNIEQMQLSLPKIRGAA